MPNTPPGKSTPLLSGLSTSVHGATDTSNSASTTATGALTAVSEMRAAAPSANGTIDSAPKTVKHAPTERNIADRNAARYLRNEASLRMVLQPLTEGLSFVFCTIGSGKGNFGAKVWLRFVPAMLTAWGFHGALESKAARTFDIAFGPACLDASTKAPTGPSDSPEDVINLVSGVATNYAIAYFFFTAVFHFYAEKAGRYLGVVREEAAFNELAHRRDISAKLAAGVRGAEVLAPTNAMRPQSYSWSPLALLATQNTRLNQIVSPSATTGAVDAKPADRSADNVAVTMANTNEARISKLSTPDLVQEVLDLPPIVLGRGYLKTSAKWFLPLLVLSLYAMIFESTLSADDYAKQAARVCTGLSANETAAAITQYTHTDGIGELASMFGREGQWGIYAFVMAVTLALGAAYTGYYQRSANGAKSTTCYCARPELPRDEEASTAEGGHRRRGARH